jgi:dTDP-D-glucose 4,6-dehydratase
VEPELLHQAGRFFYFSHEKASRQLAWEPKRTIENAIHEAHDWFQLPLSPSVPEINNGEGLQSSK